VYNGNLVTARGRFLLWKYVKGFDTGQFEDRKWVTVRMNKALLI
jgi:hypothetical protein